MKLGIVYVLYATHEKHVELALQTLNSFRSTYQYSTYIVENKCAKKEWFEQIHERADFYIKNDENCLSKAWNIGIREAIKNGADYVIVANMDIIFRSDTIDNLIDLVSEKHDGVLWSGCQTENKKEFDMDIEQIKHLQIYERSAEFSLFCIKRDFFDHFPDGFDENIKPAYWEDIEMKMRIIKTGKKMYASKRSLFFHHTSSTRRNDEALNESIFTESLSKNRSYVINKYGLEFITHQLPVRESKALGISRYSKKTK